MFKNLRKTNVFEGLEAPREGQVGPKLGPSWAKMGFRSVLGRRWTPSSDLGTVVGDLDAILGRLGAKLGCMYVCMYAQRKPPRRPKEAARAPRWAQDGSQDGPNWPQDGARWGQNPVMGIKIRKIKAKDVKNQKP